MAAYTPQPWRDLFVATAGASAALTGLVFVAVSLNIGPILEFQGLPERALQTLMLLVSVLIVSIAGLVPGQTARALGVELLVVGTAFAIAIGRTLPSTIAGSREHQLTAIHLAIVLPGVVLVLIGAVSLLAEAGGGLYWIVAAIVGAILGAGANAWVLLVEIRR